jgi:uncharacterized membrane protein YqjE
MSTPPDTSAFETAKAKAATLLALGHTRLELLGNELEIGGRTALRRLMLAQALLFGAGLAIVLTVIALALLFWEQRLLVVLLAAGLAWTLAVGCYLALRQGTRKAEPLFAASLAELQEDLHQLRAATGHGPQTD